MRIAYTILFFIFLSQTSFSQIIDSNITLEKALIGTCADSTIISNLEIIDVEYYSIDDSLHRGQIIVDKRLTQDIKTIFNFIKENKIIIDMVIPIKFDLPNYNTTMADLNNCYSFHYRPKTNISGSLSLHSLGQAIDINPFDNPYISQKGDTIPKGAIYDIKSIKTLTKDSKLVKKFIELGWVWGGNWNDIKDYMHFQKRLN
ncbi:MAG: M15 family metallopeptidase [Bacteroidales bacterium]|nr:M15 family metallopeptidase [Bacteroidales bacterium]